LILNAGEPLMPVPPAERMVLRDLGQFVVMGEPVAVMGAGAHRPLSKRAEQANPRSTWSSVRTGYPIQTPGGPNGGQKVHG
jgi:septal ring factor EnvC (AmiA/AmiB activator)